MSDLFLDTAYAVALASVGDKYHARALMLADSIKESRRRMITTHAVLLEIGNGLSRAQYRAAAVRLLLTIQHDPGIEIAPVTEELYAKAVSLFKDRPDKEWGLTDCVSFVLMQERGIQEALTSDRHFQQAGYRALLLEQ